ALAADSLAGCCPSDTSSPCSATNPLPVPQIGYCDPQPISNDGSSIHFPSISPALSSALFGADANVAGGSILLAHNPPKWVNFARRFTLSAKAKDGSACSVVTIRVVVPSMPFE